MLRTRFLLKNLLTSLPSVLMAQLIFSLAHYFLALLTSLLYKVPNTFYTYDIATNGAGVNIFNSFVYASSLLLSASLIFFEVGVLVLIVVYDFYHDARIPLFQIFSAVFKKIKETIKFSSLPFLFFFMLYPREDITPPSLLNFSIPDFVIDEILKNGIQTFFLAVFLATLSYLVYRNSFIAQEFFLGEVSLWTAIKKSWKDTYAYGGFSYGVFVKTGIYTFVLSFLFTEPLTILTNLLNSFLYFIAPILGALTVPAAKLLEAISLYPLRGIFTFIFIAFTTYAFLEKKEEEGSLLKDIYVYNISKEPFFMKYFHEFHAILKDKRKGTIILGVVLLATLVYSSTQIVSSEKFYPQPFVFMAHRGSTEKAFENSLSSLYEAIDKKADFMELDVWRTKDGKFVVSHDGNLKRVTGKNIIISESVWSDISSLTLKNGEKLPLLDDFLKEADGKILLNIEIKTERSEEFLVDDLLKLVDSFQMNSSVVYSSLSLETVLRIKEINKDAEVGYIVYAYSGKLSNIPVDFFSIQEGLFSSSEILAIHKAHKKVYLWTVNKEDKIREYMMAGVDGILTDKITEMKAVEKTEREEFLETPLHQASFFGFRVFY